jgi:hypothetical protein
MLWESQMPADHQPLTPTALRLSLSVAGTDNHPSTVWLAFITERLTLEVHVRGFCVSGERRREGCGIEKRRAAR